MTTALTPPRWDDVERIMLARLPDLLAAVHPRYFHPTHEHLGSRSLALRLAAMASITLDRTNVDPVAHRAAVGVSLAVDHGVPAWWVSRPLAEALLATEVPTDLLSRDVPMPFPGFVLLLPRGVLRTPTGEGIDCIVCSRQTRDMSGLLVREYGNCLVVSTMSGTHGPNTIYETFAIDSTPLKSWSHAEEVETYCGADEIQGDTDLTHAMTRLAVNAVLLLQAAPTQETPSQVIGRARSSLHGAKVDVWSPRWLGRTYASPRELPPPTGAGHASPRMHWRRGHWRWQVHGEGRQERKRLWIEPMLVGAKEAT